MAGFGRIQVVVGGQYGSEGKGAVCKWLALESPGLVCCRVGGPNAGHTAYDGKGRGWKLQQVPVGAPVQDGPLVIGAGSEVDPLLLGREICALEEAGIPVASRLLIDQSATILTEQHGWAETEGLAHGEGGLSRRIGSTGKGVGAARADRIWRKAFTVSSDLQVRGETGSTWKVWDPDHGAVAARIPVTDTALYLEGALADGRMVQIEGTQGYGLGLHTENYPFVTSGDCRAIDMLAQAGVSPWSVPEDHLEVWVVFRTFPIRVAGTSGPLRGETTWEELGQPPEITTVTRKQRRVGAWDHELARAALHANGAYTYRGATHVALLFLDYQFPELKGCLDPHRVEQVAGEFLAQRENELEHQIRLVGTGPNHIVRRKNR